MMIRLDFIINDLISKLDEAEIKLIIENINKKKRTKKALLNWQVKPLFYIITL